MNFFLFYFAAEAGIVFNLFLNFEQKWASRVLENRFF